MPSVWAVWVLIIIFHGWGAGVGSNGNAVTSVEFLTKDRCEAARAIIDQHAGEIAGSSQRRFFTVCVEK